MAKSKSTPVITQESPLRKAPRWLSGRPALQAALVLAALLVVFFFDILFLGKTLQVSRTIATVYPSGPYGAPGPPPSSIPIIDNTPGVLEEPYLAFKRHELAAGRFPLWNPHQAAGLPFAANPQATLFLPELPLYLFPPAYAWDLFLLARLFAAGFFTYLFLRLIGCAQVAAIGGGAAYMLSGPLITWLNNVTMNPDCLLPLLLYAFERLLRGDTPWAVSLAASVVALSTIGGHAERSFWVNLVGLIYLAYRVGTGGGRFTSRQRMARFGVAYLLGISLGAISLVPFLEFLIGFGWSYRTTAIGLETGEIIDRAITILIPYLFQAELVTLGYNYSGWSGGYLGAGTLLLALLGITRISPLRLGPLFGVLLAVALAKCYSVPGINLLGALPLLNRLRFSLHLPPTIAFLAAGLVGIALDRIGRSQAAVRQATWFASALLVAAFGFVLYHLPRLTPSQAVPAVALAVLLLLLIPALLLLVKRNWLAPRHAVIALISLLVGELFVHQPNAHPLRYNPFVEPPYIRWLKAQPERERVFGLNWALFPNTATAFQIDDLGIYEALFVRRFTRFINTLIEPSRFTETARRVGELRARLSNYSNPFLDLLNLRYLILPQGGGATSLGPGIELVYDADVKIFRRAYAMPRAYTVTQWKVVHTEGEALAALQTGFDFRSSVLLEAAGQGLWEPEVAAARPAVSARITRYTPNRVLISATTEQPAILILADTYYPGWEATVDGQPAPVLPANALLRGVPLPTPGIHLVEFRFRPRSVVVGGAISLVSIGALVAICWRMRRCRQEKA